MKILLISHTCQSRSEGQPKALELSRFGDIELRVLIPERFNHYGVWREAELPEEGEFRCEVQKVALPWAGPALNYLHWYPGLSKLLREFQPDLIDLWEEPWALVSAHACRLRNRILPRTKIVIETEQNIFKKFPAPFAQLQRYTIRNADHAVARSREAAGVLQANGCRGPVDVVPNAVDMEVYQPLDREKCRKRLGLDGFVAGYAGRFVERKGLVDMIEALARCESSVNLLFVGEGEFQPALEKRAEALGCRSRVRFLPSQPPSELASTMNAMDVMVLPSHTDGSRWKEQFGRVIIEAHACGTPVIGSDSGAIPDVVGEGGLIFAERDSNALAAAIERLRKDEALRNSLGAAGRRQVRENYTWKRVAEQMREVYVRCLEEAPERALTMTEGAACL